MLFSTLMEEDVIPPTIFLVLFGSILFGTSSFFFYKLSGTKRKVTLSIIFSLGAVVLYLTSIVPLGRIIVGKTVAGGVKLQVVQYPAEALFYNTSVAAQEASGRWKVWQISRDDFRWPSVVFEQSNSGKVRILRKGQQVALFDPKTRYLWVNGNIHPRPEYLW